MLRSLLTLLIASIVSCQPNWNSARFISLRDSINADPASTWKAAIHAGIPYDDENALRRLCGTKIDPALYAQETEEQSASTPDPQAPGDQVHRRLQDLPTFFDLRQAYPKCWSISYIRDQGSCGSCWAVSAMNSLSDRYCIKNYNDGQPLQRSFSYQDPLECCSYEHCNIGPLKGCDGGRIDGGFIYAQKVGVVTGENYQNFTSCKPYSFPSQGGSGKAVAPRCSSTCTNTAIFTRPYSEDRLKIRGYSFIRSTKTESLEVRVMKAIMTKGSVIASFKVYTDFYLYSSGVYEKKKLGYFMGAHAVRVIGWGTLYGDVPIPYWIVANSWGKTWGMKGFFWMSREQKYNSEFNSFFTQGEI